MRTAGSSGLPRGYLRALLGVSLLFVAGGIGMILTGTDGGVGATALFGTCAAIFVWRVRPELFERETLSPAVLISQ